jgi:hypothetical protein
VQQALAKRPAASDEGDLIDAVHIVRRTTSTMARGARDLLRHRVEGLIGKREDIRGPVEAPEALEIMRK